jgi:pilus assembly protein CpaE
VGWCIAEELHINTTIVDFDLPFGTLGLDFNDEAGQGVAEALSAPERLDDMLLDRLLIKRGEHLSLFTAPAVLERDYDAAPEAYEAVIDAVRQSTPCVIIDMPHAWTPWSKACLIAADEIVIVATPDLASLRNAKNIIELVKKARPDDILPRLVINQANTPKRPEIPSKDFAETMGIDPISVLPFDPALFGQAANNGQMLIELQPKAGASEAVRRLARTVTGRSATSSSDKNTTSLFSFLKTKKQA